ncbi:DUF3310 domain-containing protein [Lacticaseibacillus absianus]|uniref:DUF3310 domain-containing protein n=1 Tax=Lacticaseibacillus absianus TaxID=2729623 RepID=UPI0015CB7101|nr:DUF3310 domain-containing protein [Lacticaseibacillus absianus]
MKTGEAVNHPAYYNRGTMEVIDIIKAVLSYHPDISPFQAWLVGTIVKYLCRFGGKDDVIQEIAKMLWYTEALKKDMEDRK